MTALVTIDRNTHAPTPADGLIRAWATETLAASSRGRVERPEICIRITDTDEAAHFNKVYRSKTQATNVLSFPADLPPGTPSGLLGDLVICAQVVQQEEELGTVLEGHGKGLPGMPGNAAARQRRGCPLGLEHLS